MTASANMRMQMSSQRCDTKKAAIIFISIALSAQAYLVPLSMPIEQLGNANLSIGTIPAPIRTERAWPNKDIVSLPFVIISSVVTVLVYLGAIGKCLKRNNRDSPLEPQGEAELELEHMEAGSFVTAEEFCSSTVHDQGQSTEAV